MAKTDDLFKKNDLTDATEPVDNSAPSTSVGADKPLFGDDKPAKDEPQKDPQLPPLVPSTTQPAADDPDAPTPSSPSNPEPNIPGKLPHHGVENENTDVVQDATQKQFVHQAFVYVLRAAKELSSNIKQSDTKYSQLANEMEQFLNGFTGRVESVQSDVPQAAGIGAAHGDPGFNSHVKI